MDGLHYYNEFDAKTAAWLRSLISAGLIPNGVVDERSITEVQPADLVGYVQHHFFAGIGGWSLALCLAGWPADRRVWTGSCPCQPFSTAGKRKGKEDERHLWPVWFDLIRGYNAISQREPVPVFGEQVASAIRHGWLDGVCTDLEGEDYAVGHAVLGAHSVGAPHIRQRLYWVADSRCQRDRVCGHDMGGEEEGFASQVRQQRVRHDSGASVSVDRMGVSDSDGREPRIAATETTRHRDSTESTGGDGRMGESFQSRLEGLTRDGNQGDESRRDSANKAGSVTETSSTYWSRFDIIPCRDGKVRRVKSGLCVLAHGIPGRVGLLRGYGNAIVPEVAAEFVKAYLDVSLSNGV